MNFDLEVSSKGAYAKTVEVETVVIVTVPGWRAISPATAGPARKAEIAMLASIVGLSVMFRGFEVGRLPRLERESVGC